METCKDSVAIEDMVMELVELSVRPVSESVITGIKKDFPTFAVKVSEFLNLIHADAQWGKNKMLCRRKDIILARAEHFADGLGGGATTRLVTTARRQKAISTSY